MRDVIRIADRFDGKPGRTWGICEGSLPLLSLYSSLTRRPCSGHKASCQSQSGPSGCPCWLRATATYRGRHLPCLSMVVPPKSHNWLAFVFCNFVLRYQTKQLVRAQHVQQISELSIAGIIVETVVIFSAITVPREELL